jgi:hypothetical protein
MKGSVSRGEAMYLTEVVKIKKLPFVVSHSESLALMSMVKLLKITFMWEFTIMCSHICC